MSGQAKLLEYSGHPDHKTIDRLLVNLKKNRDFKALSIIAARRVYAIVDECLENIAKHSVAVAASNKRYQPFINVTLSKGLVSIHAGNPVPHNQTEKIDAELDLINRLEECDLLSLYDSKINSQHETLKRGAGLGFMLMKLKSRNNINFSFSEINDTTEFFEIEITVNQNTMRKLVIEKTSYSPAVIFDPDRNKYEISGESRPPDVAGFYSGILNWFDDYSRQLIKSGDNTEKILVDLDFEYFNSSSAKYILDFCKKIAEMRSMGKDIMVKWHYEEDDSDMLETGREMSKMARFPFEYATKIKK